MDNRDYPEDLGEIIRFLFKHRKLASELYPYNPVIAKTELKASDLWNYMTRDKEAVIAIYKKVKFDWEKEQM